MSASQSVSDTHSVEPSPLAFTCREASTERGSDTNGDANTNGYADTNGCVSTKASQPMGI